jgi:hypothetical protein
VDVVRSVALAFVLPEEVSTLVADRTDNLLEVKLDVATESLAADKAVFRTEDVEASVGSIVTDVEEGGVPMIYELMLLKIPPVDVDRLLLLSEVAVPKLLER